MAKYIHKDLSIFIKTDAKKIKKHNKTLKNTDIQNTLSTYFGWRHFNELKLNIDKIKCIQDKSFTQIKDIKFKELNVFKEEYIRFINDKFNNGTERHIHDPLFIKEGLFYRLKTPENNSFINKIESLAIIAKKEKLSFSYDLLKLYAPLYRINIKNGKSTPEEAYKENIEYCRCYNNCPNPNEYGDCGGCELCTAKCFCNQTIKPIDNPFDLMSWMMFTFDEIILIFDNDKPMNEKKSILFLKDFEKKLNTKYLQADKSNGEIINKCKKIIQKKLSENIDYRIKIANIFKINRTLRFGLDSCLILDGLAGVALNIFFDTEEDEKNLDLFLTYKKEDFLHYLADYKNNSFTKEISEFLYLCFENSELLNCILKITKIQNKK